MTPQLKTDIISTIMAVGLVLAIPLTLALMSWALGV
jgi:uncharacterized membrane protein